MNDVHYPDENMLLLVSYEQILIKISVNLLIYVNIYISYDHIDKHDGNKLKIIN